MKRIFWTEGKPETARAVYTWRGGRHIEFGYALALGHRITVIGPRETVFHHLPEHPLYIADGTVPRPLD